MWARNKLGLIAINERIPDNVGVSPIIEKTIKSKPVKIFDNKFNTTAILRRSGCKAPSFFEGVKKIGMFTLMAHQIETIKFFLDYPRCFCTNGLGTGKTLSALTAAEFLRKLGQIRRILIVAPKSALRNAWEKTIFSADPSIKYAVLKGDRRKKQEIASDTNITYIIVNPESLQIIENSLPCVDLVIADESTKFKTWRTQRTQALYRISLDKRIWMLTGTPTPQEPTDAYAQIRVLRGSKKYVSFTVFRDMTMYKVSKFKWKARPGVMETVAREMQPCIRFSRDECLDLPDLSVIDYKVPLTSKQSKAVKELQDSCLAQLDGSKITAINAASVLSKCLQVMAGAVYGEPDAEGNKPVVSVDATDLFEAINDIVEQNEQPVLIYTTFRSTVFSLVKYFKEKGVPVEGITSDTSVDERTAIFDNIQTGATKVMVAVAQTVAHGITLTNADTIIWVTPPMSFETYDQANGRIYRKGQTRKCTIYHIYQDWISRMLIKRLQERTSLQNTLLKILEEKDVDKE